MWQLVRLMLIELHLYWPCSNFELGLHHIDVTIVKMRTCMLESNLLSVTVTTVHEGKVTAIVTSTILMSDVTLTISVGYNH